MIWKPLDSVRPCKGMLVKCSASAGSGGLVAVYRVLDIWKFDADYRVTVTLHGVIRPGMEAPTAGNQSWRWRESAWSLGYMDSVVVGIPLCPKEAL